MAKPKAPLDDFQTLQQVVRDPTLKPLQKKKPRADLASARETMKLRAKKLKMKKVKENSPLGKFVGLSKYNIKTQLEMDRQSVQRAALSKRAGKIAGKRARKGKKGIAAFRAGFKADDKERLRIINMGNQ